MQKRKGQFVLPVTQQDASSAASSSNHKSSGRRPPTTSRSDWIGVCRYLAALVALGFMVVGVQRMALKRRRTRHHPHPQGSSSSSSASSFFDYHPQQDEQDRNLLPLADYDSLRYALQNSQLVALYFAASWCSDSTPVSLQIDQVLSDILLPPPPRLDADATGQIVTEPVILPQRHGLSLVYVSSDRTLDDYNAYLDQNDRRSHWMAVPYDTPELALLKQRFHTCAKTELEELKLTTTTRQHELPPSLDLRWRRRPQRAGRQGGGRMVWFGTD
jgi:hypothetical protein